MGGVEWSVVRRQKRDRGLRKFEGEESVSLMNEPPSLAACVLR